MALKINTNIASLAAQRQLAKTSRSNEGVMKALASGNRFDNPSESPADFTIAEHLRGQLTGVKSGLRNAESANSMIQVAEGGLSEQSNILIRLRELAIQSASDTFSDTEREMLNVEYSQLLQELDRIAVTTRFGSNRLLDGTEKTYEYQVGAYNGPENVLKYESETNTRASSLGVDGLSVADKDSALDSIDVIDEALQEIGKARAGFASVQSRLESVQNNGQIQIENLEAARSRLADTDIAQAAADMFKAQALTQFQIAVMAQANQQPIQALKLLL